MGILDFCTPALVSLIISAMGILGMAVSSFSILTIGIKALFAVLWAWILNWICSKGYPAISWILVLMPYIFVIFILFIVLEFIAVAAVSGKQAPVFTKAK